MKEITMTDLKNKQEKQAKLQRVVAKFDFLSIIAVLIILAAVTSSLLEKSK